MAKFEFSAGIAVRYYGTITVEADSLEDAKRKIQEPMFKMSEHFEPNGGGDDDIDFDYHKPAVHLFNVVQEGRALEELNEDLPEPPEGL
ncbi:hypothetical protein [Brucella intermedia]|uniref:hypothetical protein n=1 Tax=Brucella intermedia TaxID=94625 RepID=UPI00224AC84C|nr:hypothetical protein [Brucella intermedia]